MELTARALIVCIAVTAVILVAWAFWSDHRK